MATVEPAMELMLMGSACCPRLHPSLPAAEAEVAVAAAVGT